MKYLLPHTLFVLSLSIIIIHARLVFQDRFQNLNNWNKHIDGRSGVVMAVNSTSFPQIIPGSTAVNNNPSFLFTNITECSNDWCYRAEAAMKISLRKSVIPNCTSEYWIGTSLFIPSSWSYVKPLNPPADKPLTYHFQVHGGDNEGQAPNLGIREEYGNFTVNVCGSTGPPSDTSYSCQYFKIGPIDKGRWIDFVIHSKLAFGSPTGFVQVWKDGSLVVDAKNLVTSYDETNPPYIIAGSYQFNWKENVTNVGYSWTACYHKEVRVGDASSSYDEVNTGSNPLTTPTPTISPSFRPTRTPSFMPSTLMPTIAPTIVPTLSPSKLPTRSPTTIPTYTPSQTPSRQPSLQPSQDPTRTPTLNPSFNPSQSPSESPSFNPSQLPSTNPTDYPSPEPSAAPSLIPSQEPSIIPTIIPSHEPSMTPTFIPSQVPSAIPSAIPSQEPSVIPSLIPSLQPTINPTDYPSQEPSASPSVTPTFIPSQDPSEIPSVLPSFKPTVTPSYLVPSTTPSFIPSQQLSHNPTFSPSVFPTPTVSPFLSQSSALIGTIVFPIEASSSLSNVSFSSISVLFASVFSNVSLLPSSLVSLTSFDHVTSASSTSLAKTASKIQLSSSSYSYSVSLSLYYDDRVVSWQERGLEVFEEEVRRNMSHAFRSGKVQQLIISTSTKMNVGGLDGVIVGNYSMVLSVLQPSSSPTPSIGSSSDGSTLSDGAVIGISVGGAAVLVFVLFVFAVWNKSHKSSQYSTSPVEDVELGKTAGSVVVVLEEDPEFAQMQSNNDEIKL
eukprot:gene13664-15057_t